MIYYIVFLIIFFVMDMIELIKKNSKKEILIYIVFTIIAVAIGIYFFKNEYKDSLFINIAKLLKIEV